MSQPRRPAPKEHKFQETIEDISVIASIAQLFLLALTVVYSNDPYDLWDLGIAGFSIFLWIYYRDFFARNSIASQIGKIGFSISIMIVIMFFTTYVISLVVPGIIKFIEWAGTHRVYGGLITSAIEVGISSLVYVLFFLVPELWKKSRKPNKLR